MECLMERGETAAGGETAVVGVRTRARAASAMATSSGNSSSLPHNKIRKVSSSETTPYNENQLRNHRRGTAATENSVSCRPETTITTSSVSATNCSTSEICSEYPAASSCCSSNKDRLEIIADPEVATLDTSPKCFYHCRARGERNSGESDGQESPPIHRPELKSTAQIKTPSDSEIEEFFSVAEKDLHKRFTDKYNFDVTKDVPLEGRYEWVPIKP